MRRFALLPLLLAATACGATAPSTVSEPAGAAVDRASDEASATGQEVAGQAPHAPVEGYPHPVVFWEIMTPDMAAARAFYTELFGWTVSEEAVHDGDYLTVHSAQPGYGIPGGIGSMEGAPPYLTFYVWTQDVQAALDAAVNSGGTLVMEPMTLETGGGSVGLFADPDGRIVGVYSLEGFDPASLETPRYSEHPVLHFEMASQDAPGIAAFYTDLFGWEMVEDEQGSYTQIIAGGGFGIEGGLMQMPPQMAQTPPYTAIYVGVPDLDAYYARAQELGATGIVPPNEASEGVAFAMVMDPDGNMLGLFRYEE